MRSGFFYQQVESSILNPADPQRGSMPPRLGSPAAQQPIRARIFFWFLVAWRLYRTGLFLDDHFYQRVLSNRVERSVFNKVNRPTLSGCLHTLTQSRNSLEQQPSSSRVRAASWSRSMNSIRVSSVLFIWERNRNAAASSHVRAAAPSARWCRIPVQATLKQWQQRRVHFTSHDVSIDNSARCPTAARR